MGKEDGGCGGEEKKIVVVCIFCLTFSLEKCIYRSVNSEVNNNQKGG